MNDDQQCDVTVVEAALIMLAAIIMSCAYLAVIAFVVWLICDVTKLIPVLLSLILIVAPIACKRLNDEL